MDLANTSFIEGDEGVIVIDTLLCAETGKAALDLYREHRGDRPIKAIIYTHSHADHFGGVKGFVSQEEVDAGAVKIIAPEGFVEHAVSENVYAGTAMNRRAGYMFRAALARGPQGQVGAGLGQTLATGNVTRIAPTGTITTTGHEDATHTFHNLLTLRGAVVRDPHGWSQYLTETIDMFGDDVEVVFASHHWPMRGKENVVDFLSTQRDIYAYVHDQTLRMINQGLTGPEIAEKIELPPSLRTPGVHAATTVQSTITSRRSTSATSAGLTATRLACGNTLRSNSRNGRSSSWAELTLW